MFKFTASKDGHEFTFEAPTSHHESVDALRGIGYTVTEIAHLAYEDRYVNAFGGRHMAYGVATWVQS